MTFLSNFSTVCCGCYRGAFEFISLPGLLLVENMVQGFLELPLLHLLINYIVMILLDQFHFYDFSLFYLKKIPVIEFEA